MTRLRALVRRISCRLTDCQVPHEVTITTVTQLQVITDRLDRLIQQRIANNIMEAAYLERLRKDEKPRA